MKKILLGLALAAIGLGMVAAVYAASPTAQVFIHVTVVSGQVSIERSSAQDVYLNQVVINSTTLTSYSSFRNDGDTRSNWSIDATNTRAWTFLTDAPGTPIALADQVRLSGLWRADTTPPVAGDYAADDTMSNTSQQSSASRYAVDADAVGVKGYDVDPSAVANRFLYFRLDTPITGTVGIGANTDFTVTVTAASAL